MDRAFETGLVILLLIVILILPEAGEFKVIMITRLYRVILEGV